MTLSGLASKYAQLYIVTKGASLLQNTPRRDGDLLYNFSNYVVDDPNYVNNDYDAFSTGMAVLVPPASGRKISIYYKNRLDQTDGAPIWVSLRLSDHTLTPQNTLQTPLITGDVDLLGANQLGVSADDQVVLSLPTEVPPPPPTPVPNAPYYCLNDGQSYHVSFTKVPLNSFVIAFTNRPATGYFSFFFVLTSSEPGTLQVNCDTSGAFVYRETIGSNSNGTIYAIRGRCAYSDLDQNAQTNQITLTPNLSGTTSYKYVWSFFEPIPGN